MRDDIYAREQLPDQKKRKTKKKKKVKWTKKKFK